MNTQHRTNAGNLPETRATCKPCGGFSAQSTSTAVGNAIQRDTHCNTSCQLCKNMAHWDGNDQDSCESRAQNDLVINIIHGSPPNKTSTGGGKVRDSCGCSGRKESVVKQENLKNTTDNHKPSGSCGRACHKSRKQCQCQCQDRPSHSIVRPSNNGNRVANGVLPKSRKLCYDSGCAHKIENNNYNRPEIAKSPMGNKETWPQRGSNPTDVTPTQPEKINGIEFSKKFCDLTNVFLTNIGNIMSADIPHIQVATKPLNTPVRNVERRHKLPTTSMTTFKSIDEIRMSSKLIDSYDFENKESFRKMKDSQKYVEPIQPDEKVKRNTFFVIRNRKLRSMDKILPYEARKHKPQRIP